MTANFCSDLESMYSLLDIEENTDRLFDDIFVGEFSPEVFIYICGKSLKNAKGMKRHRERH